MADVAAAFSDIAAASTAFQDCTADFSACVADLEADFSDSAAEAAESLADFAFFLISSIASAKGSVFSPEGSGSASTLPIIGRITSFIVKPASASVTYIYALNSPALSVFSFGIFTQKPPSDSCSATTGRAFSSFGPAKSTRMISVYSIPVTFKIAP